MLKKQVFLSAAASAFFVFLFATPAHADPHAVFYTVTGQQQLFFNTLAALDQAEYVEPAVNTTGTEAGASRQELEEKRTTAGLSPETDPRVIATKTDLSSILTRSITLEGNDVWTAYLASQKATDRERIVASNEVTEIYCELGLGIEDCENTGNAKKNQSRAFITNPDETSIQPFVRGAAGTLASGLEEYDKILEQASVNNDGPWSYSQEIADLRNNNKNNEKKKGFISSIIDSITGAFIAKPVDPKALDGVSLNKDGTVSLTNLPDVQSPDYIDKYMQRVNGISNLPSNLLAQGYSADQAVQKVLDTNSVSGEGGGLGNFETYRDGKNGPVRIKVTTPAGVKEELAEAPVNQIAQVEQNRNYAPPSQNEQPEGNQQLTPPDSSGNVAGIASDNALTAGSSTNSQTGQVAGLASDNPTTDPVLHNETNAVDPAALSVAYHHEPAPLLYLKALGLGKNGDGCGCSLNDAVNDFGQVIIAKINE